MPKLWSKTVDEHRAAVRDAIIDTTAGLVSEHGLLSVNMSELADRTGIGRATLYKYFPDIEAILHAWHERQISGHLEHLVQVRDHAADAGQRLEAVLEAFALHVQESRGHQDKELAALMHGDGHVAQAQQRLQGMIGELLTEAVTAGEVRDDVEVDELASFCLHSLTAASRLRSKASVRRLLAVTMAGLRAEPAPALEPKAHPAADPPSTTRDGSSQR